MDNVEFLRRHPRLFHLAHAQAWPDLQEHGLLSTAALVSRSSLTPEVREQVLTERRPEAVHLEVPDFESVVVRDQAPLNLAKLAGALTDGMTTQEWLSFLNSLVFLFPDRVTLETLYEKYKTEPAVVVELNARSLVEAYGALVRVSSINSGATVYVAASRGRETFRGIRQFDNKRKVKEVALTVDIPDLASHVVSVERWEPDGTRTPLR